MEQKTEDEDKSEANEDDTMKAVPVEIKEEPPTQSKVDDKDDDDDEDLFKDEDEDDQAISEG